MSDGNGSSSTEAPPNSVSGAIPEVIPPSGAGFEGHLGLANGGVPTGTDSPEADTEDGDVLSPAKVIRIGAMIKQLLEEARNTNVDEAAREQLSSIYNTSLEELKSALSTDLGDELESLSFDFKDGTPPSESELRMAQAQLVGWLEGLFHGIQAMMVAQQMAARQQLEGGRPGLSERTPGPPPGPGYI